jgi:LCP family protein required for cell wall assembly
MEDHPLLPTEPPEPSPHLPEQPHSHESVKVNLDQRQGWRRHPLRIGILGFLVLVGMGMVGFGVYAYRFTTTNITDKVNQQSFFGQMRRIIDSDAEPLRGEKDDRINIALLGQGGDNHPGGTLIDTIMVVSIKPSTNQVALLSLPRDLVVPYQLTEGSDYIEYLKINNAVYYGGVELAKEKITDVTGLEMHYYALVDFAGFRDIIDSLGGVDVTVVNPFTDYEYPDYNYGYQTVSFTAGTQHMSGEKALQFSRSRHGNNNEGSDFARAARQQLILEAVRQELLSASTFLNPTKVTGVFYDVGDHVSTDMEIWEMLRFAEIAKDIDREKITNEVVDNREGGLLFDDRGQNNAYILIPRAGLGDYSEIHALAEELLDAPSSAERVAATGEDAIVTIQNGSSITGLATSTADVLTDRGLTIDGVGNGLTKATTQTVVYDVSDGAFPLTAALLADYFGVVVQSASLPSATNSSVRTASDVDPLRVDVGLLPSGVDFIILLGSDAPSSQNTANTAL